MTQPPFGRLHASLLTHPEVSGWISEASRIRAMLEFEIELAAAQTSQGWVPERCVAVLRKAAADFRIDWSSLASETAAAGTPALPLIRAFTAQVEAVDSESAAWIHFGATSQDVLDTALVLQLRDVRTPLLRLAIQCADAAATHAREHSATLMPGRTWLKHASPITFGFKAAGWLDALARGIERMERAFEAAQVLQFGGATGSLGALGGQGPEIATELARRLRLRLPELPWHAHRDRLVELAAALATLIGSLGKLARDVSLLAQTEVGEAREGGADARGESSAMPHKQNSVHCSAILTAATRAPALVATLLSAMPHEHERALGAWQSEWDTLPDLVSLCGGALMNAASLLEGLEIHAERMHQNLELTRGLHGSEWVAANLAPRLGRTRAHRVVAAACARVSRENLPLLAALQAESEITAEFDADELARMLEPGAQIGSAQELTERCLQRWAEQRSRHG